MKYVVRFNEVGHKYPKFECRHVEADSKEEAIKKIKDEEWSDIIDEFDVDELTEGYEVTDIWEID